MTFEQRLHRRREARLSTGDGADGGGTQAQADQCRQGQWKDADKIEQEITVTCKQRTEGNTEGGIDCGPRRTGARRYVRV